MKKCVWFAGVFLAFAPALAPALFAQPVGKLPAAAAPTRVQMELKEGWRFKQGGPSPTEWKETPDATWTAVSVPHTWNRAGYYKDGLPGHLNRPDNVNLTQGVGWYKLVFNPPASVRGKHTWLQFDAASRIATVWLNGQLLGSHAGGFSRFRFDATAALLQDRPNTLTVEVDNTRPAPGTTTENVLPLLGDFFVYGGLYRPVTLVATAAEHIDMMDFGSSGVYGETVSANLAKAHVKVRARVRNDGAQGAKLDVFARLVDAKGRVAAEARRAVTLDSAATQDQTFDLDVPRPHLWQGVQDPYLYSLCVEVRGNGVASDEVSVPFGLREVHFNPEQGLFLNGRHVAVHGVGYHQDREGKGWASEPSDVAADVATMREMGATGIRLTHYQHGQPIHDLADRDGLVVWDEIPLVSMWTFGNATEPTAALRANARQQLHELIAQDFNHPSVITWSIANEVDFGNTLPIYVGRSDGTIPDPLPFLRELNAFAHTLDASRPTTLATCCEGRLFGPKSEVPLTAAVTDLAGANRYYGWYYETPGRLGPQLDNLHKARPTQPVAVTEYGAGGALSLHSDNPLGGPESRNRPQAEEYESYIHEQNWSTLRSKPYLWGSFVWASFDFASTTRSEGNAQDVNTKGLVNFDHVTRKDPFYFYKAQWTAHPTVHITSSRYKDRAYRVTPVRVYSNARSTSLRVNGRLAGTLPECPDHICLWNDVDLRPGENVIVAEGSFATGVQRDRVVWQLSNGAANSFRIDCGALVAASSQSGQFGSDTFFQGGTAGSAFGVSGKPTEATKLAGTRDQELVGSFRTGTFTYDIPVKAGDHTVKLTFVEPASAAGARRFSVSANGVPLLNDLDIAAAAGGARVAYTRTFPVKTSGQRLKLDFAPSRGEAIVSAIEVD